MNTMKRWISFVLCFVMVMGILPLNAITAWAEETGPVYVLAGSDFQNTGNSHAAGATQVTNILNQIQAAGYTTMDGFLFAGDYDYGYDDPAAGKAKLQETVQAVYGTGMHEVYVEGNHDSKNYDLVSNGTLNPSGENDADAYGVYVIHESDYMWYNDDEVTIKKTANNLKSYLDAKRNEGYTKPIFVISHLPLHYSMRTQVGGGDGKHANYIFNVLNEAGANGLNIIFLFGHNHSHGWDDPYGGAAIFLTKGDSINIAQNSTTNYNVETLNFTYMNAGYVSYYRNVNTGAEIDLSMTTFEISGDEVIIARFTDEGLHDLKSAGVANSHASTGKSLDGSCSDNHGGNETYSPDTSVVASSYTLKLNKDITPAEGETIDPDVGGTATGIELVTELEQGVPYIIVSDRNGLMLTGTSTTNKDGYESLLLDGTASTDTEHIWYYDGTHLIYGDPDSTSTYLLMSTDTAYLGESHEYRMVDDVYLNDDGETFTLKRTDDGLYLNQYGGGSYTAASPYDQDGNADDGSKWLIYELITETTDPTDPIEPTDPVDPEPENPTVTKDGVAVKAPGITALTVVTEGKTVAGYSAYMSFDINPEGYTQGDEAEVTVALDMSLFNASRPVLVIDHELDTVAIKNIVDGTVTFTTNHFSTYDVAQADAGTVVIDPDNWVEIEAPTGGTTTYAYTLATSITAGGKYVIVDNDYEMALMDSNGSMGKQTVSVNGTTMTSDNILLTEWTFPDSTSSGTVNDGSYYFRFSSNAFSLTNSSWYASTVYFFEHEEYFEISGSSNTSRGYSLYYNGSQWTTSGRNSNEYVRLYTRNTAGDVTTTGTPGTYGTIVGTTTYEVGVGTSWDTVKAQIQAGIDIYYTNDNTATTGTQYGDNAENMSWTCADYNAAVPGEYTVTIAYNGVTLGTAKVTVQEKTATRIEVSPMSGKVQRGSGLTAETGSTMTVTYDDGTTAKIPVTLGMLRGDYTITKNGTYSGLTVQFGGQSMTGYTLEVVNVVGNDFPAYPTPGSVELSKHATVMDQNTGLSRVELTTSGLPTSKGVDVVVMLDTSSSMAFDTDADHKDNGPSRLSALKTALRTLLETLQKKNASNQYQDIDIAIADFNNYTTITSGDSFNGRGSHSNNTDPAYEIFTGDGDLNPEAGDFEKISDINIDTIVDMVTQKSGTNYDYAFDTIYKLAAAKQAANTEDRDLFVIFMSDGAPFQFNYFTSKSDSYGQVGGQWVDNVWDHWLTGEMTTSDWANYSGDHDYFYNEDGLHWMAEAIKGDQNKKYPVIVKDATKYLKGNQYMTEVDGLGATMYTIGLGLFQDKNVDKATIETVIERLASLDENGNPLYISTYDADELEKHFEDIAQQIRYAATDAVFLDQLGDDFKLQMATTHTNSSKETITVDNKITVSVSNVYTVAQVGTTVNGHPVTNEDVGKPYGSDNVIETVTFNADGTVVSSTAKSGNILVDGVICAENFFYNSTSATKTVTLKNGTTYELPAETFYWDIGRINEKQYTLSYLVYLEGSMEGTREPGSYLTNNYAKLSYVNWLGNEVEQEVASPSVGWKAAQVSYGFYLVDTEGNPLSVGGSRVPNFLTAYKVAGPILHQAILLNDAQGGIITFDTINSSILPAGYTMYDEAATYKVVVNSGEGGGSWEITKGKDKATTYVTDYAGATDYSNTLSSVDGNGVSYFDTTVWFAVVWNISAKDDTVVIDYGLPVDISVMVNDGLLGELGSLNSVGKQTNDEGSVNLHSGFGSNYRGSYGTATVMGDKIRYTPSTMAMGGIETFSYAGHYKVDNPNKPQYYYGTVTVIPATTVYYEDSFIDFASYSKGDDGTFTKDQDSKWATEGTVINGIQAQDRPGTTQITGVVDANNNYGYDAAYENMSTYSMGSAAKITVDASTRGEATFTFYGTGFDVISMTSNTTGTLIVQVFKGDKATGTPVKTSIVDTYYGMNKDGSISLNNPEAIWQVPVMKIFGLTYGQYTVKIIAGWNDYFDHKDESNSYDLYLDAIRIYDPTGNQDDVANGAYKDDGEGWPVYAEVRDLVIKADSFNQGLADVSGVVFIDCVDETNVIADYKDYGPNNELYLANGQAIAFKLALDSNVADVQIGMKAANGVYAAYEIYNATTGESIISDDLNTTTDMYYSIGDKVKNGDVIVIKNNENTTGSILSLTNIKVTHLSGTTGASVANVVHVDDEAATNAVNAMALIKPVLPTFNPETMNVRFNRTTAAIGNNVVITVTTSTDVENLLINGQVATNKATSYVTGETVWSFTVPVVENGSLDVRIVGFDADGQFTIPHSETVTVVNMSGTQEDLLGKLFG